MDDVSVACSFGDTIAPTIIQTNRATVTTIVVVAITNTTATTTTTVVVAITAAAATAVATTTTTIDGTHCRGSTDNTAGAAAVACSGSRSTTATRITKLLFILLHLLFFFSYPATELHKHIAKENSLLQSLPSTDAGSVLIYIPLLKPVGKADYHRVVRIPPEESYPIPTYGRVSLAFGALMAFLHFTLFCSYMNCDNLNMCEFLFHTSFYVDTYFTTLIRRLLCPTSPHNMNQYRFFITY